MTHLFKAEQKHIYYIKEVYVLLLQISLESVREQQLEDNKNQSRFIFPVAICRLL